MASRAFDPENPYSVDPRERTVGQTIGEAIRLYGRNFWKAILAATPPIVIAGVAFSVNDSNTSDVQAAIWFLAIDLAITLSFVLTCWIVLGAASRRALVAAFLAGITVAIPVQVVFVTLVNGLQGLGLVVGATTVVPLLLTLFGLAVPAAVAEDIGYFAALRRALELGRAQLFHAWGAMAVTVLLVGLSWVMLWGVLVNSAGLDSGPAGILGALVLGPLPLLAGAALYEDQRERARPLVEEVM